MNLVSDFDFRISNFVTIMSSADSKLDARLREVPLPDGLLDRLMALPLAGDRGAMSTNCCAKWPLPPDLLERLQAMPLADDEGLDEARATCRSRTIW